MKPIPLSLIVLLSLLLNACQPDTKTQTKTVEDKKIAKLKSPKNNTVFKRGDTINVELSLKGPESVEIDSIAIYFDNVYQGSLSVNNLSAQLVTEDKKVGRRKLFVKVYKSDGSQENKYTNIKLLAKTPPKQYGFKIQNSFAHNINSYTQGLIYNKGFLYESTGQRGFSKLLKTEITTGEALQNIDLDDKLFGEGLTVFKDKLYQLTWTAQVGLVYNLDDFTNVGSFSYSGEGWGLTSNEEYLIMSNGTNELQFINPSTFKVERTIQVMSDKGAITKLNELEYVNGEIWANFYEYNVFDVYRIDPKNGEVLGVINFNGILKREDYHNGIDVFNGIAYDEENDKVYVTGKNYPKIWEVEVIEK